MTTTAIQNSCLAGALAGLMANRFQGSFVPTDYAAEVNVAAAIAAEFITQNTASGSALADGDNANIGAVVQSAAMAATLNTGATSTTATDYEGVAKQIYASSKQALASLV
jgi:hypothetical protein